MILIMIYKYSYIINNCSEFNINNDKSLKKYRIIYNMLLSNNKHSTLICNRN